MMKLLRAIPCLLLAALAPVAAETPDFEASPWLKPRSLQDFRALLDRSPFSLPTAEEISEVEDRFFLTGAATINEQPVVFVFDKNTQNRLMLEKLDATRATGGNHLIEFSPSLDPKNLTAKVQIEGKVSQIRFAESSFEPQGGPQGGAPPSFGAPPGQPMPPGRSMPNTQGYVPQQAIPGQPIPPNPSNPPQPGSPAQPAQPQNSAAISPGQPTDSQPPRRVIRRRVISNPSQPASGQ